MRGSTEASRPAKGWHNGVEAGNARADTSATAAPISHEQCEVLYSALQDVCTLVTYGVMANTAILSLHYADATDVSASRCGSAAPTSTAKTGATAAANTNVSNNVVSIGSRTSHAGRNAADHGVGTNNKSNNSNNNNNNSSNHETSAMSSDTQTSADNKKSGVTADGTAAGKPLVQGRSTYIAASARLAALRQGIQQLKSLQNELEQRLLCSALAKNKTVAANTRGVVARVNNDGTRKVKPIVADHTSSNTSKTSKSSPESINNDVVAAAEAAIDEDNPMNALAALRASANAGVFAEECRLSLPISDYRIRDKDRPRYDDIVADDVSVANSEERGSSAQAHTHLVTHASSTSANTNKDAPAAGAAAAEDEGEQRAVHKRIQPLVQLLQQVNDMQVALRNTLSAPTHETSQLSTTANKLTAAVPHTESTVLPFLQSALEKCVAALHQSYAQCNVSTAMIQGISTWPRGLLRLFSESVHREPLNQLTEATAEKLRRICFDAEELEQEQQQAVVDGDMHRSEALYFQQATLLESMKPYFDKLEAILTSYRVTHAEKPMEQLRQFQQSFRSSVASAISKEKAVALKAQADLAVLAQRQLDVAQRRDAQWAGMQLYREEWNRVFDDNASQQMSCLKAMEELERRLANLAQEQSFLVRDRMAKVRHEAQREADAMAFFHFVRKRADALSHSLSCSESAIGAMEQVSGAIESSCALFDTYLTQTVKGGTDAELMRARMDRLGQFRSLYLTLGDLHYKKSRHAEEIAKKIEYYGLQQEIAMDELNPKAKDFSQSKRKWQDVQDEINAQIRTLDSRSEKQLEDFRPTEQLLLESKVAFKHPKDELQERNLARTQRLLEYKKLMDDAAEGSEGKSDNSSKKCRAVDDNLNSPGEDANMHRFGLSSESNGSLQDTGIDLGQTQSSAQMSRHKSPAPTLRSVEMHKPRVRGSSATQSRSGNTIKRAHIY